MTTTENINTRTGFKLRVEKHTGEEGIKVCLCAATSKPCVLHWGARRRVDAAWQILPAATWPAGTTAAGASAMQTPFARHDGESSVAIRLSEPSEYRFISFVLFFPEENRWDNNGGRDYQIALPRPGETNPSPPDTGALAEFADEIIRAESHGSWTLMHRYNLCHDLLERARGNVEVLAFLYVWLRFSAIRQLTWQRNYNTQPRDLSHAQERLTHRLAEFYRSEPDGRPLLRLMLATVGRGGEGQRIRDEILQIMHRHHIKEVTGHFMEEWHQKLHNNTTPDDIVICEAYLEFLYSNGNRDRFYQKLAEGGVTRQRLETFERPIRTQPDFVGHLKDGLIHDFQNFLRTLKAVHAGADFETAIHAAQGQLDSDTQGLLWHVWHHRNDPAEALVGLVEQITRARQRLAGRLNQSHGLRELLYLDLALEQLVRVAVERNFHSHLSGDQLVNLIASVLENLALSHDHPGSAEGVRSSASARPGPREGGTTNELAACLRHWERLRQQPRFGAEWSLHAKSVTDRIGRALSDWIDRFYRLLQPKAEYLGRGFAAEPWSITLFSEEVVRGSSLGFVLSTLLRQLDPLLRQAAHLGAWQIVSRGRGTGKVAVITELRSIQGRRLDVPTVVVTEKVSGDEEIPEGVAAVIAPDVTDLVSHVAVRARNASLLFASCHDAEVLQQLKSLQGHRLHLEVSAAGDVIFEEAGEATEAAPQRAPAARPRLKRPEFSRFAVALADFNEKVVGAKSLQQARLCSKLPDWVRQPPALAIPFGTLEKVLSLPMNKSVAERIGKLLGETEAGRVETLAALRETLLTLSAPEELKIALRQAAVATGLSVNLGGTVAQASSPASSTGVSPVAPGGETPPELAAGTAAPHNSWDAAWQCIKRVWASKWNERAFLSRKTMGLAHDDLFMAVLIQPVVEADYAFVIHTTNPATGNRDELYAEAVLGLGETLVGNYPGRALSFTADKKTGRLKLMSFPSKSAGLYGGGLIFRSDSNGEDLAGYAGAGLYDSVMLPEPQRRLLDYAAEPLVWDEAFRNQLLGSIAKLGAAVETVSGAPQDIEGVVAKGELYLVQARPQVGIESEL